MSAIKSVRAREILDSRGNPTVEVDLTLASGAFGRAAVPSGASTGSHEAAELRDGDKSRYKGKGVLKAVSNIATLLAPAVVGKEWNQRDLDLSMISLDGTENKEKLGANSILGISLSFAHAQAAEEGKSLYQYFNDISHSPSLMLPVPLMNILNGGKHAMNSTDLQEFMIVPIGAPAFKEALQYGAEVFHTLKKILEEKGLNVSVGDEGGYAPSLSSNEEAIKVILQAIEKAGYVPGKDIALALDVAANELYKDGVYELHSEGKRLTNSEMVSLYEEWIKKYPLVSIEDGLAEDDWDGYVEMTKRLGDKVQIVGDDLFVTNQKRLQQGIEKGVANSILIKLNQIGTVTETIDTIAMARKSNYTSIISHRSGETEDTSIADFAVGLSTGQIKTGSLCRSERIAKYNQLLRIEEKLGTLTTFPGASIFKL